MGPKIPCRSLITAGARGASRRPEPLRAPKIRSSLRVDSKSLVTQRLLSPLLAARMSGTLW